MVDGRRKESTTVLVLKRKVSHSAALATAVAAASWLVHERSTLLRLRLRRSAPSSDCRDPVPSVAGLAGSFGRSSS